MRKEGPDPQSDGGASSPKDSMKIGRHLTDLGQLMLLEDKKIPTIPFQWCEIYYATGILNGKRAHMDKYWLQHE